MKYVLADALQKLVAVYLPLFLFIGGLMVLVRVLVP